MELWTIVDFNMLVASLIYTYRMIRNHIPELRPTKVPNMKLLYNQVRLILHIFEYINTCFTEQFQNECT